MSYTAKFLSHSVKKPQLNVHNLSGDASGNFIEAIVSPYYFH